MSDWIGGLRGGGKHVRTGGKTFLQSSEPRHVLISMTDQPVSFSGAMHRLFSFLIRAVTRRGSVPCIAGPEGTGDPRRATPISLGASDVAASSAVAPPSVTPRWPSSALFRWEEQAGPRDAWDALPFPPGGPGLLDRLRAAAAASRLLRGRDEGYFHISLSFEFVAGGSSRLLPLKDDEDVEKAVQLWLGAHGAIVIVAREEGDAATSVPHGGRATGGRLTPSLLNDVRGPLPLEVAPEVTAFEEASVDIWTSVLKAVASDQ